MAKILVAGLNPAWQRVLALSNLHLGAVNRADATWSVASGKGINTAKALRRLGHDVSLLQVLAGENGRRCQQACDAWGLRSLSVWEEGETRTCTTLLSDRGEATELIEPFALRDPEIETRLLQSLENAPAFDAVVICGTLPRGISESFYARLLQRFPSPRVIWDAAMGLTPELLPRLTWLKVNAEEYAKLKSAFDIPTPTLITAGPGIPRVLHSRAADGAYRLPYPIPVRNPIGAGDTVTAGLADGLINGLAEETAVKHALALGAASCATVLPAEWDADYAAALEAKMLRESP